MTVQLEPAILGTLETTGVAMAKPLNEYREERYLTVDEFADLLGVTPQTLYRIMRGIKPRPTTIRKIAERLAVHPTEIVEFVRKRPDE